MAAEVGRPSIASDNVILNRSSLCCSCLLWIVDERHSRAVAQLWSLCCQEILLSMVRGLHLAVVGTVALVMVTFRPPAYSVLSWRSMW